MDAINIGLIGLGTVGTGVVKILRKNRDLLLKKLNVPLILKKVAYKNLSRPRTVDLSGIEITNAEEIINDPEINIVIELIGGYEPAKTYILTAIKKRKHVVTANKALLALYGEEIFKTAMEYGVDVAFEASVGGGIPLINGIKEGLVGNNILCMFGILNGTANYILTKMTKEGVAFKEALKEAQEKGFAEADPTFDIEGIDTAHKLTILLSLVYGIPINFEQIYIEGIGNIDPLDIQFAQEFGYRIKLLAVSRQTAKGIESRVHPTMIPIEHLLANVNGAYNALLVRGDAVGNILFYGLGAGMMPAGSAVVSDVVSLSRNLIKGITQRVPLLSYLPEKREKKPILSIDELICKYYFRFSAVDKPGVLSKISGILGNYDISIESVMQKGRKINGQVPIVMLTHEAKEANVKAALNEIEKIEVVKAKPVFIRIENDLRIE
ncbi:homoserine dehydrogenase [Candidatus Desulfofervidus auxilii]|uniref:Homoserine dehydrogenase n=2 Tax=Desulfofervidus auxilii TaxID=1621989 RepID=A0A7U4QMX5_DESA2|nr:homoserine dehydrogenase [Candidatus Desulfofervidus auxilii]AMM42285.1 homoserine dehydrogenase [Candidatus Desulfofervidus auxilii]